jgi:hypothetical protein
MNRRLIDDPSRCVDIDLVRQASWEVKSLILSQIPIIVNMYVHVHLWVEGEVIPGHLLTF